MFQFLTSGIEHWELKIYFWKCHFWKKAFSSFTVLSLGSPCHSSTSYYISSCISHRVSLCSTDKQDNYGDK